MFRLIYFFIWLSLIIFTSCDSSSEKKYNPSQYSDESYNNDLHTDLQDLNDDEIDEENSAKSEDDEFDEENSEESEDDDEIDNNIHYNYSANYDLDIEQENELYFLICDDPYNAYSHHIDFSDESEYCEGLKECIRRGYEVKRLLEDDARDIRSDPCDFCYGH